MQYVHIQLWLEHSLSSTEPQEILVTATCRGWGCRESGEFEVEEESSAQSLISAEHFWRTCPDPSSADRFDGVGAVGIGFAASPRALRAAFTMCVASAAFFCC